jgi:hypothetical protein
MTPQVVNGATLLCSFGAAPATLIVLPVNVTTVGGLPAATIMDFAPIVNIPTFGMCNTPSNPTVAGATAAALGVLTPMPCVPVTVAPWVPGAVPVLINNLPALDATSKCMCTWGGVITITMPGQVTTTIP